METSTYSAGSSPSARMHSTRAASLSWSQSTRFGRSAITRLYRYYASMDLIRNRPTGDASGPLRLPAGMVEDAVVGEIRRMIRAPEIAARTITALRDESPTVDEKAVVQALGEFDQLWAALFPAEQSRIVQLLVERVTVGGDGIAVDLRQEGLGSVLRDMMAFRQTEACA
jgi:site-specific DNA recombinase